MYCRLPYVSKGALPLKTLVLYIYRPRGTMQYNQQLYAIYSFYTHDIPSHFVIGLLQVNKNHMRVFLLLPTSLHMLPYQENHLHNQSPWHESKLVFGDVGNSL
jgi:hypothetical protein